MKNQLPKPCGELCLLSLPLRLVSRNLFLENLYDFLLGALYSFEMAELNPFRPLHVHYVCTDSVISLFYIRDRTVYIQFSKHQELKSGSVCD